MNRKLIVLLGIMLTFVIVLVGCTNNVEMNEEKNELQETENLEHTNTTQTDEEDKENEIKDNNVEEEPKVPEDENKEDNENTNVSNENKNPIATMTMKNGDVVKMELYPEIAPETVKNFISLANSGFYNGLIFHRVIPSFMAQGGDPEGNGMGGPNYSIKGEFKLNGVENNLTHDIGVVSMARSEEYNSAGSQFFIVTDDEYSKESLDGQYAGFGKVIEGMEHVYTIVNSEVIRRDIDAAVIQKANQEIQATGQLSAQTYAEYYAQMMEVDRPKNPPVIKTITVETFGVEYGEPTKY